MFNKLVSNVLLEMAVNSIVHTSKLLNNIPTHNDDDAVYRDYKVFNNPSFIKNLQTKWSQNTPFIFNLILADTPTQQSLNVHGTPGTITVVIDGNDHVITPWMVGHRVGHAIQNSIDFVGSMLHCVVLWLFEHASKQELDDLGISEDDIDNIENVNIIRDFPLNILTSLFNITKFKGKNTEYGDPDDTMDMTEWCFECVAQYLKYGHISFFNSITDAESLAHQLQDVVVDMLHQASKTGKVYMDAVD